MSDKTVPQTAVDLSHAGVDNILAALANAGVEVHYNETDGETFLDIWLTDLDADTPVVLGWRESEGRQLRSWDSKDTVQPPTRKWPIEAGTHAEVARDVAAILAKGEEPAAAGQQSWYFTFGSGQQYDGRYVVITDTYDTARDEMLRYFGNAWSFQYASAERAGTEEFGLVELARVEWPPTVVDRALAALSAFGVTTAREAGQLLPMWLHFSELTADDRTAVYQHYRTELAGGAR